MHLGVPFPRKLDRAMLIMAFGFEAFIFSNHFGGREPNSVDTNLHIHLAVAVYGVVLFCILEAYNERQVLFSYGRCLFTALLGTWFFQIAIALYLPFQSISFLRWPTNNPVMIPEVTFYFCIHFFVIFVLLFAELWVVQTFFGKNRCRKDGGYKYRLRLSSTSGESLQS